MVYESARARLQLVKLKYISLFMLAPHRWCLDIPFYPEDKSAILESGSWLMFPLGVAYFYNYPYLDRCCQNCH